MTEADRQIIQSLQSIQSDRLVRVRTYRIGSNEETPVLVSDKREKFSDLVLEIKSRD